MKIILKRGATSFAISAFAGLVVNLLIDGIVNATGAVDQFVSMSPEFVRLFPTVAIASYINVLMYGVIGATFAMMTFLYDIEKIGFVLQNILYFCATSVVLSLITMVLWQLQRYPKALVITLLGYGITFVIMGVIQYKALKKDIASINEAIIGEE